MNGDSFASEAMASHFDGLMSILRLLLSLPAANSPHGVEGGGGGSRGHAVPPDLVRNGLCVLEASHRGGGLFRFPPFVSRWLQPLLTDALKGLAEGAHPLLQEEVRRLVFDMAEVRERGCDLFRPYIYIHMQVQVYIYIYYSQADSKVSAVTL